MVIEHVLEDVKAELTKVRRTLDKLEATLSRLERKSLDDGY